MASQLASTSCLKAGGRVYPAISRQSPRSASTQATTTSPKPNLSTPSHSIIASVLLNRSPTLTTLPTPFERAYHEYQSRIARALSNPFPREFYFKKGAIAERQFFLEESQREKEAFGEGFGEAQLADLEEDKTGSMRQTEDVVALPRKHESDLKGDTKNLNRKGERNIYLLVKGDEGWRLPQGPAKPGTALHNVALQELHSECGPDMDTWVVGRHPIGIHRPSKPGSETILFFKAHIFAGQAKPNGKSVKDFAWLTREEIQEKVAPAYWESIRDMLSSH